ncbi:MAG: folate-binding protein [Gammaproteobacteria bacterium]|nr:MAG: folate-binding protein [Gammaproteobacteria bacterium]RLA52725.1 MAG: folate-binding protein [Gammaproteobacteria bacterium]
MTDWQQFLADRQAQFVDDEVISFGETSADYANLTATISDLGHLGILSAEGPDSRKFLQGQSTCDFLALSPGDALPGAICNPKGRMITSFQAQLNSEDEILLSMDRALVKTSLAALEKYAAFFKTTLQDHSNAYRQFGLAGTQVKDRLKILFPSVPGPRHSVIDKAGNLLTCVSENLFVIITKAGNAQQLWVQLSPDLQAVGLPWWQLQLIRAGLASVTATFSEQLIPQMLNLQATDAISFSKGCYTGQEVVARMQYLGKLKRRTYLVLGASSQLPEPGAEITTTGSTTTENATTESTTTEKTRAIGNVITAAPTDPGNFAMLAILREMALDQTELLVAGQAVPVKFVDLPYEINSQ